MRLYNFSIPYFSISALYLGNYCFRWCMYCSWKLRVNHTGMYPYVSYTNYGWSLLWISRRIICFRYYYYLGWYLLVYYGAGATHSLVTHPSSWPWRITQQWVGFHNWIGHPPCELFHGLMFFLWILIILPNYNGVEWFYTIILGQVIPWRSPVLVIEQHIFQYLHGEKF